MPEIKAAAKTPSPKPSVAASLFTATQMLDSIDASKKATAEMKQVAILLRVMKEAMEVQEERLKELEEKLSKMMKGRE